MTLAGQLDWVAKHRLLDGYRERHGLRWDDARLRGDGPPVPRPAPGASRWPRGSASSGSPPTTRSSPAMTEPPPDTRAYFRGGCLQRWADEIVAANWDSLVFDVGGDPLRRVPMMEPLRGTEAHVGSVDGARARRAPSCSRPARASEQTRCRAMAEREQKKKPAPAGGARRSSRRRPPTSEQRREDQGRARRSPRRDRRGARDERRGLREELRPEGRRVARSNADAPRVRRESLGRASARPAAVPLIDARRCLAARLGSDPGAMTCRPSAPTTTPGRRSRRAAPGRAEPRWSDRRRRRSTSPTAPPCVAVRYADGVVMAGDRRATVGQPHQPPHDGEGVPGRPLLAASPSPAPPGPAMEMVKLFQLQLEHYEKVEGAEPQPRGQGQPARPDGAQQPARRHAGPRRRAAVRRLRRAPAAPAGSSSTTSPAAATRSSDYAATGLGQPARRHGRQARLPRGPRPRRGHRPRRPGAVPGGRRGLGHRRSRPGPGHLPGRGHHHRRRLRPRLDDAEVAERFRALLDRLAATSSTATAGTSAHDAEVRRR